MAYEDIFSQIGANDPRFKLGQTTSNTLTEVGQSLRNVAPAPEDVREPEFVGPIAPEESLARKLEAQYGIPYEMGQEYLEGPHLTPKPKGPGFGQMLKIMGLGMVPVVGPAYAAAQGQKRQQELESWKTQNLIALQQYQKQEQLIRPVLTKEMELNADNQAKMKTFLLMKQQYGHFLDDRNLLRMAYGHAPETTSRTSRITPHGTNIVLAADPTATPIYAQANGDGTFNFRDPISGQPATATIADVIHEYPLAQPKVEKTPTERRSDQLQAYAEAIYRDKNSIPPDVELTDAQAGRAWQEYQQSLQPAQRETWGQPNVFFTSEGQPVPVQASNLGKVRKAELPEGAVTKQGLTSQTRVMAEASRAIIPKFDDAIKQLSDPRMIAKLGPIMGRWNDWMIGRVGSGDPQIARLRATIGLLQTGAMRAHVGARGGVGLMSKFEGLFNSQRMDVPTLKASLAAVRDFLKGYRDMVYPEQGQGDVVIMVTPDGREWPVPVENVEAAKQRGAKVKQNATATEKQ